MPYLLSKCYKWWITHQLSTTCSKSFQNFIGMVLSSDNSAFNVIKNITRSYLIKSPVHHEFNFQWLYWELSLLILQWETITTVTQLASISNKTGISYFFDFFCSKFSSWDGFSASASFSSSCKRKWQPEH